MAERARSRGSSDAPTTTTTCAALRGHRRRRAGARAPPLNAGRRRSAGRRARRRAARRSRERLRQPRRASTTRPSGPSTWAKPAVLPAQACLAEAGVGLRQSAATSAFRAGAPGSIVRVEQREPVRSRGTGPSPSSTTAMATPNASVRRIRIGRRLTAARPRAAGSRRRAPSRSTRAEWPVDLVAQIGHVHGDDVRAVVVADVPGRAPAARTRDRTSPARRISASSSANSLAESAIGVAAPDLAAWPDPGAGRPPEHRRPLDGPAPDDRPQSSEQLGEANGFVR